MKKLWFYSLSVTIHCGIVRLWTQVHGRNHSSSVCVDKTIQLKITSLKIRNNITKTKYRHKQSYEPTTISTLVKEYWLICMCYMPRLIFTQLLVIHRFKMLWSIILCRRTLLLMHTCLLWQEHLVYINFMRPNIWPYHQVIASLFYSDCHSYLYD